MGHPSCFHTGYQLTCAEYDELRDLRDERCHLCGCRPPRLEVDHDHALGTWAVRGLLCRRCNRRIGLIEAGTIPRTDAADNYLAKAWHVGQASSAAKRKRAMPRAACPACGLNCAIKRDGLPVAHWSRVHYGDLCSGEAPE